MIEDTLKTHIMSQVQAALPDIDPDQVIVTFGQGDFLYGKNKSRDCLGTEKLLAEVSLKHTGYIDRVAILRAFPRANATLGAATISQKYTGHKFRETVKVSDINTTILRIEFKYNLYEE